MTLDRADLTVAERTTLTLYPVFSIGMGLALLLPAMPRILATPAFRVLSDVIPIRTWGVMLLLIGAVQVAARFVNRIGLYVHSLGLLMVLMGCWALVFGIGAWHGDNLWTAVMFAIFPVGACYASAAQLLSKGR